MSGSNAPIPDPAATGTPARPEWGSDVIAEQLRAFDIPFISMTPGSSYRGLHDSIVNHLGNSQPQMVLSLHEEHAVAVAHGYAKAAGKPLLVGLHANVGLMHAVMAIYNAYCDRVPMLIIGANGPLDAAARRPWIDWLHSSADPGALVRSFVRWDDQPTSVAASLESLMRGLQMTTSYPSAPVYVCLDVSVQEQPLDDALEPLPPSRYAPPAPAVPSQDTVDTIADLLRGASNPMLLVGRVTRDPEAWARRVALAEAISARVATDLRVGSTFPTSHALHVGPPGYMPGAPLRAALRDADVVLSLDWIDLGGALSVSYGEEPIDATVISCTADASVQNGWSKDHFELPVADVNVSVEPDVLVEALLPALDVVPAPSFQNSRTAATGSPEQASDEEVTMAILGRTLRGAVGDRDVCLARVPLGWAAAEWDFHHPLDCLGADGGGGLGSGPGMTVGTALALRDDDRLVVGVLGDGDTLMGASALWTAANLGLPVLVIAANNGSFFNDEIHQGRVAERRDRPAENAWIGVRIDGPRPDLAEHIRGLGVKTLGPVTSAKDLDAVLREAVQAAESGPVFVDVHVTRNAYQLG
jgi:thiamine pyrophosphate-dependent acetolactate synthase large subunit-like protein